MTEPPLYKLQFSVLWLEYFNKVLTYGLYTSKPFYAFEHETEALTFSICPSELT